MRMGSAEPFLCDIGMHYRPERARDLERVMRGAMASDTPDGYLYRDASLSHPVF